MKSTFFADDATFALDGSLKSFNELINTLEAFKSISGLKLNNKKTSALRIGSLRNTEIEYMKHLNFSWSSESAKTLGITFFSESKRMQEYNFLPKLCDFSNCLKRWSHRKLTLMGKITVVKTFALPKLIYPFTVLADPTKQIINKLTSEIFSFIWDSKPDKIQRTRLYQDYKNGGLRLINLEHFIYSLKASWLKRIFENENEPCIWKTFYTQKLDKYGGKLILECNLKERDCTIVCKNNVFLKDILIAWCKINYSETQKSISKQIIWNNSDIKCFNTILYYKQWQERGIKYIEHIYDYRIKQFYNFEELQNLYDISDKDFLKYYHIVNNIREDWKSLLKEENPLTQEPNKQTKTLNLLNTKQNKITKFLYSVQLQTHDNSNKKSEMKWTNEFLDQNIDWDSAYLMAFRCTNDVKLRNFQYKYLMRIVPNNRYLFKCKIAPTVLCDFCSMQEENNAHLFWDCIYSQEFWSHIRIFLNDNIMQVDISYLNISFGILNSNSMKNEMINYIILLAKYYIYSSKYKQQKPNFEGFKNILK